MLHTSCMPLAAASAAHLPAAAYRPAGLVRELHASRHRQALLGRCGIQHGDVCHACLSIKGMASLDDAHDMHMSCNAANSQYFPEL